MIFITLRPQAEYSERGRQGGTVHNTRVWFADVPFTVYDAEQRVAVIPKSYSAAERARALVDLGRKVSPHGVRP